MKPELISIMHFCGALHLDCWGQLLEGQKLNEIASELEDLDDSDEKGNAVVLYLSDEQVYYAYAQHEGSFEPGWYPDNYPEKSAKAVAFLKEHGFELTHTYINQNSDNVVHVFVRPAREELSTSWYD